MSTANCTSSTIIPPKSTERLLSIDILRGLIIILMTWVNYAGGIKDMPLMFRHAAADADLITLADMVVPGFLFIVGVSIPFAFHNRLEQGEGYGKLFLHIFSRTGALLFLGIWWVNKSYYSPELTGMSIYLWYTIGYLGVFLAWNVYPKVTSEKQRKLFTFLKFTGVVILLVLMAMFRGKDSAGNTIWLQTSWWGILGQIGWAYCFCAIAYILCKGNPVTLMCVLGLTLAIYIGGKHGSLDFLGGVGKFLGVGVHFGTKSSCVMAGIVAGVCISGRSLWRTTSEKCNFLLTFGILLLISGILLRPLHTFSKLWCTDSYALTTSGIWCLLLLFLYRFVDIGGKFGKMKIFIPIGQNPLLLYLLPNLLNNVLNLFGIHNFVFQFCGKNLWLGSLNILIVGTILCVITTYATKKRFILKL